MSAATDEGVRELTIADALNEALREEMERDAGVFVIGEDVAALGGLFQVTAGLLDRFGPAARDRLRRSRRRRIAGAGVGAALVGCRPVVELQIVDFVTLDDGPDRRTTRPSGATCRAGRSSVPLVLRGADLERHRHGRPALPDARGVVRAHARASSS